METGEYVVAATKLRAPTLPERLIVRSALHDRLHEAVSDPSTRVVLVSAAAGSGKSTLLAGWFAEHPDTPVRWLQLEEADEDPARFWTYLAHAVGAGALEEMAPVLAATRAASGDPAAVLPRLVNALEAVGPRAIVLDDYHLIGSDTVHAALDQLIELLPVDTTIVLSSRTDPPLRLGRLRVRNQLIEIRSDDLRFAVDDAPPLLGEDVELDRTQLLEVVERTEGWAAGLVLAGQSIRRHGAEGATVDLALGSDRLVADYLVDELLGSTTGPDRRRMLQLSALDRISGPLVDAVCGTTDGTRWLAELAATNQLVVGLDATGTWYRYHHLLRDMLRVEADRTIPDQLIEVHRRASAWFEVSGDLEAAIDHAIAAAEFTRAVDLVFAHATTLLNAGQLVTVSRHLTALGDSVEDHYGCAALTGWIHLTCGRSEEAALWLDRTLVLGDTDGSDPVVAPLAIMWNLAAGDVDAALGLARAVAEDDTAQRTALLAMAVGAAHTLAGLHDRAASFLAEADERAVVEPDHLVSVVTPVLKAMAALDEGDRQRAHRLAARSVDIADQHAHHAVPLAALAHSILGWTSPAPDGVVAAELGLRKARSTTPPFFLVVALAAAGDVLAATDPVAGVELLREARRLLERCPDPGMIGNWLARTESRHRITTPVNRAGPVTEEVSDRELAVLRHLTTALSQREIAAELFVSVNTIKSHTRSLYRKLDANSRKQAVQRARELGLL